MAMDNYIGALILLAVSVVVGVAYLAYSKGMFGSQATSVQKQLEGATGTGAVQFQIITPSMGKSFYATTTYNGTTVAPYVKLDYELTGDGNQLNQQWLVISSLTKGWCIYSDPSKIPADKSNVDLNSYFKGQIGVDSSISFDINKGDVSGTVYLVANHDVATSGEKVTVQFKVGGIPQSVDLYVYPSS